MILFNHLPPDSRYYCYFSVAHHYNDTIKVSITAWLPHPALRRCLVLLQLDFPWLADIHGRPAWFWKEKEGRNGAEVGGGEAGRGKNWKEGADWLGQGEKVIIV